MLNKFNNFKRTYSDIIMQAKNKIDKCEKQSRKAKISIKQSRNARKCKGGDCCCQEDDGIECNGKGCGKGRVMKQASIYTGDKDTDNSFERKKTCPSCGAEVGQETLQDTINTCPECGANLIDIQFNETDNYGDDGFSQGILANFDPESGKNLSDPFISGREPRNRYMDDIDPDDQDLTDVYDDQDEWDDDVYDDQDEWDDDEQCSFRVNPKKMNRFEQSSKKISSGRIITESKELCLDVIEQDQDYGQDDFSDGKESNFYVYNNIFSAKIKFEKFVKYLDRYTKNIYEFSELLNHCIHSSTFVECGKCGYKGTFWDMCCFVHCKNGKWNIRAICGACNASFTIPLF